MSYVLYLWVPTGTFVVLYYISSLHTVSVVYICTLFTCTNVNDYYFVNVFLGYFVIVTLALEKLNKPISLYMYMSE